jgi:hypothetical protein
MHGCLHSEVFKGKGHFGEVGVDTRIIVQRFFTKLVEVGTGEGWFNYGPVVRCCEHGNESLNSVKNIEYI